MYRSVDKIHVLSTIEIKAMVDCPGYSQSCRSTCMMTYQFGTGCAKRKDFGCTECIVDLEKKVFVERPGHCFLTTKSEYHCKSRLFFNDSVSPPLV